ncbi:DinB family protein [Chitinophaga caseinilytica]|uniref:DinB family protein n=1 Tax=Chitinophaga caseinilytica TaxID=2267521 RepID=A0ABZ2Z5M1_9BACT
MKDLLVQLAGHNAWANGRLMKVMAALPDEQLDRDMGSSFPTLRKTVLHVWNAESVWYQRLLLASPVVPPAAGFSGGMEELAGLFVRQSEALHAFVSGASDAKLAHTVEFNSPAKGVCKTPVTRILMQAFTHSAFHRGQLVTMLRQQGVPRIPSTDFIEYTGWKK